MLTPEERIERRKALGASDIAAIMGHSRFRTPEDVRLEKLGRVDLDEQDSPSDATFAGSMFEGAVLTWAESQLGPLERKVRVPHPDGVPLVASLDALCAVDGAPVEGKTSGLFGPLPQGWGEPGTDEIPDYYILQAQAQMACTNADVCHVPAFLGGRGFVLYRVRRSEELVVAIVDEAVRFWEQNVLGDTPCEDPPSMEVLKRLRREPGKKVELAEDMVVDWLMAADARKAAEKAEAAAKKLLLAALGDAEGCEVINGVGSVSYMEQGRKGGLDLEALVAAHPELDLSKYQKPETRYRVLRHHAWKLPKA